MEGPLGRTSANPISDHSRQCLIRCQSCGGDLRAMGSVTDADEGRHYLKRVGIVPGLYFEHA